MYEGVDFASFIRRIRAGDDQAARELVEQYEPVIRREVRMRMRDPRLYSRFDWTDICQSVMASFFVRAASGQYDLDQPDQLLRLLVVMTRHKLAKQERRHRADRRDYRRVDSGDPAYLEGPSAANHTPSRLVAGRELLESFLSRFTAEERMLADLRSQGYEWTEICTRLGGTPAARRKQLARAVDRVERQLEEIEGRTCLSRPIGRRRRPGRGAWTGPTAQDPARQFWSLWRQGQQPTVEDFLARTGIRDPEQIVTVLRVDQAERCRLGQWVPAEAYLDAFPAVRDHAECAVDLVFAEYLLREERGERPPLEEFLGRFPQYAGELKLQIELHQAMEGRAASRPRSGQGTRRRCAVEGGPGPDTGPRPIPRSPATRSWACWAGAAWGSSTGPGRSS